MLFSDKKYLIIFLCLIIPAYGVDIENKILENTTYWWDDVVLKELTHQVEVLRLNLEMNNLKFEKALTEQKTILLEEIRKLVEENQLGVKKLLDNTKEDIRKLLEENVKLQQEQKPVDIDIRGDTDQCIKENSQLQWAPTITSDCAEALKSGGQNGIYMIKIPGSNIEAFHVYCLRDPDNGDAWTMIQRRLDGSVDFFRDWIEYKRGFGNIDGEFFIGLDKLHALTHAKVQELWIKMDDFDGQTRYAKYDTFAIGDEISKYNLSVLGTYHGNAGDDLRSHQGHKFTTKDSDNDVWDKNCATEFTGAWWYHKCHNSNLNGQYLRGAYDKKLFAKGVVWHAWHDHYYSLKYVHMAIRAVKM